MHFTFQEFLFFTASSFPCHIFVTTHSEWFSCELEESQNQVTDIQTHTCICTKVSVFMKSLGQIQSLVSVSQLTFKSCISQAFRCQYVLPPTYCISNKDNSSLMHYMSFLPQNKQFKIIKDKRQKLNYPVWHTFQMSSFDVFYLIYFNNKPRSQKKKEKYFCTQCSVNLNASNVLDMISELKRIF